MNQIYTPIKNSDKKLTVESTKKYFIEEILNRLLELTFKENHSIIFRALNLIVKAISIKHAKSLLKL